MNTIGKPPVLRLFGVIAVTNLVVMAGLYWLNNIAAWSVMAGALLFVLPHCYFAVYAFRYRGARMSKLIAQSFNRGESGKYILTLVGFACVFSSPLPISIMYLSLSYIVNLMLGTYLMAKVISDMRY